MKKIYSLLFIFFISIGLNLSIFAQTSLLEGLIKVSDEAIEIWYYIENGHSSDAVDKPINDSDGRFASLLSASTTAGDISSESAFTDNKRDSQKWKVVASDETDYYYLINKEGKYLVFSGTRFYTYATTLPEDDSLYKFQFSPFSSTTESVFIKIKRKNSAENIYICQLNQGFSFKLEDSSTTANTVNANGLVGNPRAWRFVPEEQIDDFYPAISATGSTKETVGEWFRIRSLDASITDEDKYLTIDTDTKSFSLAAKSTLDNQLFGFISLGYIESNAAKQTERSYKIQIISKATGELLALDSDILTTNSSGKDWVLKHVYVPAKNEIQGVIKAHRWSIGNAPVNKILTNKLSEVQPSWTKTMDTYDNEYVWAFERSSYEVKVTSGDNVTLKSSATASLKYGQEFIVNYQVNENSVPVVTINGIPHQAGDLVDDVYTLVLTITGTTDINITAESTLASVTVNAEEYISIVSPELDANNQYFSPSSSTITFRLAEGYENPAITATKAVAGDPVLNGDSYSVVLTDVEEGAIIGIIATLKSMNITTAKGDGISWKDNQDPETSATYGSDYSLSFTVNQNYHTPKVIVDGNYYSAIKEADIYTVTLNEVKQAKSIYIGAFEENVLPVTADTWVRGGTANAGISNVNDPGLYAQYSTYNAPAYMRRSYMEFDPSSISGDFDKVTLKLTVDVFEKNPDIHIELRSAEELNDIAIADMTWSANEEADIEAKGQVIGINPIVLVKNEYPNKAILSLDVTQYVLDNKNAPLRLQFTGVSSSATDGYIRFYSDNGAALATDLTLTPVLVFEKTELSTYDVIVTKDEQITIQSPEGNSPYSVKEGETFVLKFTVASNYDPEIMIDNIPVTDDQLEFEEGIYTLTLTSVTKDISIDIKSKVINSIKNISEKNIIIYPENGSLIIKTNREYEIEIYAVSGQLITKKNVNGVESIALPQGIYLVKTGSEIYKFAF